jgi:hypothetical protein
MRGFPVNPIALATPSQAWAASACMLGLRIRIPPVSWMSVVKVVFCQVQVSATGRSLVQWSPTEFVCVIECNQV